MPRVSGVSGQLHRVPDPAQAHALHHARLVAVEADRALHERDLQLLPVGRRGPFASILGIDGLFLFFLPAQPADHLRILQPGSPANVARTTLCGFAEPSDLVSTF